MQLVNKYTSEGYIYEEYTGGNGVVIRVNEEGVPITSIVSYPIPNSIPIEEPKSVLNNKLIDFETKMDESNVTTLEVLATIYEELLMRG